MIRRTWDWYVSRTRRRLRPQNDEEWREFRRVGLVRWIWDHESLFGKALWVAWAASVTYVFCIAWMSVH